MKSRHALKMDQDLLPALKPGSAGLPGLGVTGVLASIPAGIISFIGLATGGVPFGQALVITIGVQLLVILFVLAFGYWQVSSNDRMGLPILELDQENLEESGLWRVYPSDAAFENAVRVGLIAPNTGQSRSIANVLAELGGEVHHCTDADAMLACVKAQPGDWTLVLFDLEAAPDLDTAVDDLIDFRNDLPGMPVLLVTNTVARNDFSSHRKSIGDATLRKPVFRKQLVEAIDIIGVEFPYFAMASPKQSLS